jgi:tyrosyl-tRNA synthetase
MDIEERLELVQRNTEEIIGIEDLRKLLQSKKRPVIYWGTAPTGKPHIGYLLPALKISDFLKAGFEVKILLADLHASLDNVPWGIVNKRYEYYKKIIPLLIKSIGADTKHLKFIQGSAMQLKPEYMYDVLRLSTNVSVHDSLKAASDVVKLTENPRVSGLIYPLMQAMDEEYLKVDCQLGGTDQRKIMVLARENLPKLGYKARIEIMNPLLPGLIGKKMSSSDPNSKINLTDDEETIKKKIRGAECAPGNLNNGLLPFIKYVIMTIKQDKKEKFLIKREEKFGGNISYENYEELEKDFLEQKLHPLDLKNAISEEIINLLKPIQKEKRKFEKIEKEAYSN